MSEVYCMVIQLQVKNKNLFRLNQQLLNFREAYC
jgi:hypothetical protein